ncbi:PTS mannose/fructose/sorbose transporter subunit IIB [Lactonifactor longoviformis]|uniref:PTS system, mannose-specific IIB component n=1 Tax=Lactonifactor longoviformis DSM 17459 TaxID=1122155 RepID=A0A1M4UQV1_9CLOT|nr:PTS sugar transporter subunit IIB [Lactonifactor longoviformis]POP31001.1 PTS mannose/fructose/sorbose transporter subunit IIB [Lactonifactor longoviformis]SHE59106.1 PTS system, mannose-specific IIB component [Lactonifactor longoviformis DSM 17459]
MIENLLLFRIDERMTHGQVMISYMKKYPAKNIVCIDDATAKDPFVTSIIKMSAPSGVTIDVVNVKKGAEVLKTGLKSPTIVLAKTPLTVKKLREEGAAVDEFIIGGIADASNRKRFYKSIFISQEEADAVKQMISEGVSIDVQIVVSDKRIPASTLLK